MPFTHVSFVLRGNNFLPSVVCEARNENPISRHSHDELFLAHNIEKVVLAMNRR